MKVQLIVVQGKPEGKVIPLLGPTFKIGRGETCHLRPSSEQVSREHAEFQVAADKVMLRDLGSRNGTLVNGKALTEPCVLKDRDLVQIGLLTFAVSIEKPAVAAATAPTPATPSKPVPKAVSPDDVSHADIESWLVADDANKVPDRPSGVYGGETLTITAFKEGAAAAKPAAQPTAPAAKPAPQPSAPAAQSTAPAAKPAPQPSAPAAQPTAPAAKPAPQPSAPAAQSTAPAASAPPATAPAKPAFTPAPSPLDVEDIEYERLPEGEGDVEELAEDVDDDSNDDDESESQMEDFIDESNPFYVKKKKEEAPAKPVAKDTSDVASDILRRLMDKRRSK